MPLWGKTDEPNSVPKYLSDADKDKAYFVDITEAGVDANKAKGLGTGGWNLYSTYTDSDGATRHRTENLVAMGVTAADAGDQGGIVVGADELVANTDYTIVTAGNTDFTTVGAANNDVGTTFTANGAATGTGTASISDDDVLADS